MLVQNGQTSPWQPSQQLDPIHVDASQSSNGRILPARPKREFSRWPPERKRLAEKWKMVTKRYSLSIRSPARWNSECHRRSVFRHQSRYALFPEPGSHPNHRDVRPCPSGRRINPDALLDAYNGLLPAYAARRCQRLVAAIKSKSARFVSPGGSAINGCSLMGSESGDRVMLPACKNQTRCKVKARVVASLMNKQLSRATRHNENKPSLTLNMSR